MKKNVALIIPKLNGGGAERAVSSLSFDLVNICHLFIIAWDLSNIAYPYRGHIIKLSQSSNSKLGKVFVNFKRMLELRRIKKRLKIDVSISFLVMPNLLNVLARRSDKVIVSIRNSLVELQHNRVERCFSKWACLHADKVVAVSKLLSEELKASFGLNENKIVVINNPCDFKFLDSLSNKEARFEWPFIATMGRLEKQKGQIHLIHAYAEFHQECPNIHLVILGAGSCMNSLKHEVELKNLTNYVHFPGFVVAPHQIVKQAEFFVLPSLWEGIANALLEAMACGKAVISTDCASGPREILYRNPNVFDKAKDIEYAEFGMLTPDFLDESAGSISEKEHMLAMAMVQMAQNTDLKLRYQSVVDERLLDFSRKKILSLWKKEIL